MRHAARYASILALAILITGCVSVHRTHNNIRSDISAISNQQAEAMSRNDAAAVAGFYSSDAWLFPPNEDLVKGKAGILKWWQNALSGAAAKARLVSDEVESCGETAWETGRYSITAADGKVLDKGKYVTIWKHEDGTWKLYRDIFNTDVPAVK